MKRGPKERRFTVYDNKTDRIVALDATAWECCRLMDIESNTFYIMAGCRKDRYKRWTIIDTTKESEETTVNQATIIGNLTKDPELRTTTTGVSVCGFTVAVNRPKTANNPEPGADFFNVSAWRGLGETCAKYLNKGKKVCVVGPVSVKEWDNGERHGASLEIKAEDVEFL